MPRLTVARSSALLALALFCAGCVRQPERATAGDVARLRSACPRGSFVAAMAANCPELVR